MSLLMLEQVRQLAQMVRKQAGKASPHLWPEEAKQVADVLDAYLAHAEALARAREREARLMEALLSINAAHERGEIVATGTPGFMALMSARAALTGAEGGS